MQMTLGRQLTLACGGLMSMAIAIAGMALYNLAAYDATVDVIANDAMRGLNHSSAIRFHATQIRALSWKHIASTAAERPAIEQALAETENALAQDLRAYEGSIMQEADRELFTALLPLVERYQRAWTTAVLPVSRAGDVVSAAALHAKEVAPHYEALSRKVEEIVNWNATRGNQAATLAQQQIKRQRRWTWGIILSTLLLGGLLTTYVVRNLTRQLRQTVIRLRRGADDVSSAAALVASSSQTLSSGATESAAALEQTSAATEQISAMARKNAAECAAASDLVQTSVTQFAETTLSLTRMVEAMGEIHTASSRISKIIEVIDDIAFQTNILALNASVEAARAGEAGKGFSVVADEVRSLAQRCAQAARDTSSLIVDSIAKTTDGRQRMDQMSGGIAELAKAANQVKSIVQSVNAACHEQSCGLEQIGRAIEEMNQVTQNNSANAERSAHTADELATQSTAVQTIARELTALVEVDHR